MMPRRIYFIEWRTVAAMTAALLLMVGIGGTLRIGSRLETAVELIAGFDPDRSVAVEQAVGLIHQGDYSLALLRLGAETKDTSAPRQARILGAYALLVAGDSLGAFAGEGS